MVSDEMQEKLIAVALEARKWAYAPYSGYRVGAALLTTSGKIYDGVNVENAAYPQTICAERVAIFKAVSEGERGFDALAVVTENGGAPCGACRQVMVEFNRDMQVFIVNDEGQTLSVTTVIELLPMAFGAGYLSTDASKDNHGKT
jgi:cytidine deaminase